jgi:hypothetical protein
MDDRHKVLALTLAELGQTDGQLGDLVPDWLWERLHDDGFVSSRRDESEEGWTTATPAGRAELRRMVRT